MSSLLEIEKLIKELINKIDNLATKENLEVIAAKIIKDVLDRIDIKYLMLEKQKEKVFEEKEKKYSFPNFSVGNPSLGSSKSPNVLTWHFGSIKDDLQKSE